MDPNSPQVLVLKFIQPWRWVDFIEFVKANYDFLLSIDRKFALIYDASLFPIAEHKLATVYDDLVKQAPHNPPNLDLVIMLDPRNSSTLKMVFEILIRTTHRKRILHIVNSLEEATPVLAKNGFM